MAKLKDYILNATLGIVVMASVSMVGLRIRESVFTKQALELKTRRIADWRSYGAVESRIGPKDARVTIVDFSDFQCPFCLKAWDDFRELRAEYPEKVAVVFRHFPLPIHKYAVDAARASECAANQNSFEPYLHALFSSQDLIGNRSFGEFARLAGVSNSSLFETCMSGGLTLDRIQRDQVAAKKLGVQGTPTLLINNLELLGYPGSDELKRIVRSALDTALKKSEL